MATPPFSPFRCSSCDASLPAGASFCPRCGTGVTGSLPAARRVPPWWAALGAAGAVVAGLGLVLWRGHAVPPAAARPALAAVAGPAAGPAAGPIPDISKMTPQERFDRLYDRVMQALRSGDTATVARFAPMALGAYQMLGSADDATRRRGALLRLHLGDTSAARELGPAARAGGAGPVTPAP